MLLLELKKYQINLLYDIYSKIIEEKYKTYNSIRKLYIMPISKKYKLHYNDSTYKIFCDMEVMKKDVQYLIRRHKLRYGDLIEF